MATVNSQVSTSTGQTVSTPGAMFNINTGKSLSNPVVSGAAPRSNNERTGADISGLSASYAAQAAQIQAEKAALAERQNATVSGIKSDFDVASKSQIADQGKSYAARSTSLITSGGGFLGATQSQEGVLQNLQGTFQTERDALMSKRESAILSAKTAYEDKDFALAKELTRNATDLQKEIYQRQKDYADQTLQITAESRAQGSYDMSLAEKKVAGYALMSDAQFAKVSPTEINSIDSIFGAGYTSSARAIAVKAQNVKTQKDAISLDADIMDMRLKMPSGQKFTLGGNTYTGLKSATGTNLTQAEKDFSIRSKISTFFSPGYTIPATQTNSFMSMAPIPTVDQNNYANPTAWKMMITASGLDRADFVKQYGYLVNASNIEEYGLTRPEKDLILGKL